MEAVSAFETSVSFYETTRRNIPEDSHLHTRRRENLKSLNVYVVFPIAPENITARLNVAVDTGT
jgi:hypothetical protein